LNHGAELNYGDEVVRLIASRCTEPESGGRMIDAILTNTMLPRISRVILERMSEGTATRKIDISVKESDFDYSIA
jgi:type VI secretion system protein VasG